MKISYVASQIMHKIWFDFKRSFSISCLIGQTVNFLHLEASWICNPLTCVYVWAPDLLRVAWLRASRGWRPKPRKCSKRVTGAPTDPTPTITTTTVTTLRYDEHTGAHTTTPWYKYSTILRTPAVATHTYWNILKPAHLQSAPVER